MKIVIGTDLSIESLAAVRWGLKFAERLGEAARVDVIVAHITGGQWYPEPEGTQRFLDDTNSRTQLAGHIDEWLADELGVDRDDYTLVLGSGRGDEELRALVEEIGADWLVVGTSGHGRLARLMVGSTAERLAHDPPCRLVIAHPDDTLQASPELLVGVDFSEASECALRTAAELAGPMGAKLHIVHVAYPPGPVALPDGLVGYTGAEYAASADLRKNAQQQLDALLSEHAALLDRVPVSAEIVVGYPTRELLDYAEKHGVSEIILGSVGRSAIEDFLLGSVASGVVKHKPCTVILCRDWLGTCRDWLGSRRIRADRERG